MATDFDPVPPPLDLPAVPDVLSPSIPLNPPMVGSVNPFQHVDGNNRDLILEAIRTWIRVSLLPWTTSWQDQLTAWEGAEADQLNAWMVLADSYITSHAISGYSFRPTVTDIAPAGTTNVVLSNVDEDFRPVVVGDLVLDNSPDSNYGIVTVVIDETHATVAYVGTLRGLPGYSWRLTATPIAPEGTTNVVLAADGVRPFSLGDLVLDTTADGNFGTVTVLIDATHVTVAYAGSLIGPQGIQGIQGEPGTNGTNGTNGTDGIMSSIVAGNGIAVDSSDPANPIVTATGRTWYFTDPEQMNINVSGVAFDSPLEGDVGVLVGLSGGIPAILINSDWIMTGAKWTSPDFNLKTNVPGDWVNVIGYVNPSVNTNLSMAGAHATEAVNGTHPVWNETEAAFHQDISANRLGQFGVVNGGAVINADNSISLTACTSVQIDAIAPKLALDATDEYEIHVWGVFETNGQLHMQLCNGSVGIITNASQYASFGETLQLNAGTLTHDPDFVGPIGAVGHWTIADDTTGSPVILDATIRLSHATSAADSTVGSFESAYYDNDIMSVMFKRTGTIYSPASTSLDLDGFNLIFSEAFTGKLTVKAI